MKATLPKKAGAARAPLPPEAVESFVSRHIGPRAEEVREMLDALGLSSLEALEKAVVPQGVRSARPLDLPAALTEVQALARLRELAAQNQVWRSYIGMGYSDTITPAPIQRHILENPGWYTAYTPYQAEISQGRLEALLNFQTMIIDLTGLEVANASLLDESTAAAEAMALCYNVAEEPRSKLFLVAETCHPQTVAVVKSRAEAMGLEVLVADPMRFQFDRRIFGLLLQYPRTDGAIEDYAALCERAHRAGALVAVAADPLALALLKAPGEFGADVAVGSTQRFGIPLWYGGPHAAYMATRDAFKRHMPGRIVGVSQDADGAPALRLALQTREQHIRRERATSNICTAQVLLAVAAGFYAVYHGPEGLKRIAARVRGLALDLADGLRKLGLEVGSEPFFDTVKVRLKPKRLKQVEAAAAARRINLRRLDSRTLAVALDETASERDVRDVLEAFAPKGKKAPRPAQTKTDLPAELRRKSDFLRAPVFRRYRSETELLRYIKKLESRDLSLTSAMIPLGSCTMKLNAASEMAALSWEGWARIHPFAPKDQAKGYQALIRDLEAWLCEITGFAAFSLQPNAGSQGEYAGLLAIRRRHEAKGEERRRVCLIPQSAHGTNPASAAMAGLEIVSVACTASGDIDLDDLRDKAARHAKDLAALMVTYPSTYGVFEEGIRAACEVIHTHGGLVYMDGANMNAQVGLCRPAEIGADVCHLNLHKTFAIPHGGGGPGMGPIGVTRELAAFLPRHPVMGTGGKGGPAAISAAPWGSAAILTISWSYIAQLGPSGLREATLTALLNANYAARRLEGQYPVLFRGRGGFVAHECILDLRPLKAETEVVVEDVAKRLMDYGFHAPTVSFPVPGTLMIEPTESESKAELDRFCEAMILIRDEIRAIAEGAADKADNPLKNAPHPAHALVKEPWGRPYSREKAVYPAPWTRERKFWPPVSRIDNAYGDRNFFCSCNAPAAGD